MADDDEDSAVVSAGADTEVVDESAGGADGDADSAAEDDGTADDATMADSGDGSADATAGDDAGAEGDDDAGGGTDVQVVLGSDTPEIEDQYGTGEVAEADAPNVNLGDDDAEPRLIPDGSGIAAGRFTSADGSLRKLVDRGPQLDLPGPKGHEAEFRSIAEVTEEQLDPAVVEARLGVRGDPTPEPPDPVAFGKGAADTTPPVVDDDNAVDGLLEPTTTITPPSHVTALDADDLVPEIRGLGSERFELDSAPLGRDGDLGRDDPDVADG